MNRPVPTPLEQWSLIQRHLPADVLFRYGGDTLRDRFLAGAEEYQGEWLGKPPEFFRRMIREELMDVAIYSAMDMACREMTDDAPLWGAA